MKITHSKVSMPPWEVRHNSGTLLRLCKTREEAEAFIEGAAYGERELRIAIRMLMHKHDVRSM